MSKSTEFSPLGRALVVKPRRQGFKHRPILTVVDGVGMTEQGEVVRNLPLFATCAEPHIWLTFDVLSFALPLKLYFADTDWFTWEFTDSREPEADAWMSKARLATFGAYFGTKENPIDVPPGIRKQARHVVWEPTRMFSDPSMAADLIENTHMALQRFGNDVRAWCAEQDLPMRPSLPGLASGLMRDPRFWPHARGRVPKSTNERLRGFLPGVHQRLLAGTHVPIKAALALDQRRAYHRAAQEIATPDPTTLHARGWFDDPEGATEAWAEPGDILYERTMGQPGLVAVRATARPARKDELRPPAIDKLSDKSAVVYLWTNEVSYAESVGLKIEHIVAAWTSMDRDTGLPKYGQWAENEIDRATPYRRRWLKPTLHATYGLLGSRPRALVRASRLGKGTPTVYLINGVEFEVMEAAPRVSGHPLTNVAMLGMLQAEIRQRSLKMANEFTAEGITVYHVHADGLHIAAVQTPFIPPDWTLETITNLTYEDNVSWLSDERDVLPGRDTRMRVEVRRHRARLLIGRMAA